MLNIGIIKNGIKVVRYFVYYRRLNIDDLIVRKNCICLIFCFLIYVCSSINLM